MAVSCDTEHKFDLALQLGELKTAYSLAVESEVGGKSGDLLVIKLRLRLMIGGGNNIMKMVVMIKGVMMMMMMMIMMMMMTTTEWL